MKLNLTVNTDAPANTASVTFTDGVCTIVFYTNLREVARARGKMTVADAIAARDTWEA